MSTHNLSVVMTGNATSLKGALMAAGREVETFTHKVHASGKMGMSAGKLMAAAFLTAGVAVAAGLAMAVSAAFRFDKQMRNVQSITKSSERELRAMGSAIIEMSRRLPQSAEVLAAGLYDIASSGFSGSDALFILEQSARAASAGVTDTAVASKAIVAVLNAYGLGAAAAADVSDTLFQAVNLGVLTFEELSGTIGDVVGTAAAATVGIDEVASAIATMTLSGISAAESGTSLNRTIQSILDPSDELAAAIKAVGYESGVQALQVDSLDVVMGKLRETSQGNIDTLMKWFPEIRAARGALALMSAGGENYRRVVAGIQDAEVRAGATQAALNEQMKSASMQWQLFKNKIEAGAITLGQKLLPTVINVLEWVTRLARSGFAVLGEAVSRLAPFWQSLIQIGGNVVGFFEDLWEAVGPSVTALAGIAGLGVITALNSIGKAVAEVTEFLSEHHDIATAIAILYATKVVTGFVTAGKAAQLFGKAMALLKLSALASNSSMLILRLSYLKDAFASLFMQFSTGPGFISNMKSAFSGLGSSLVMGAGIGLVLTEVTAMVRGLDNAKQKAREFIDQATSEIEMNNIDDLRGAISDIGDELDVQRDKLAGYDEGWGGLVGGLRGVLELVTPMENGLVDSAVAVDELSAAIDNLEAKQQNIGQVAHIIATDLGVFAGDVKRVATELNLDLSSLNGINPDPQKLAEFTAEIGKAVLLGDSSPRIASVGEALDVVGDSASTNAEKVDAFKGSLDRLIGIPLDVFSATTDAAQALDDLGASLIANKTNLDEHTEAGANNRDALEQATQAQKDLAQAIATDQGIPAGVANLTAYRDQLAGMLRDAQFSEEQIASLLEQMGLAPEDIEFLVSMTNEQDARTALQGILDKAGELDGTTSEPKVVISGVPDATSDLGEIERRLLGLTDKTVTVRVAASYDPGTAALLSDYGRRHRAGRWGAVHAYAAGGVTPAHITSQEVIKYGEPETGGEAFVPRKGDRNRSMSILDVAASWYGMRVVPMALGGYVGQGQASVAASGSMAQSLMSSQMGQVALWAAGGDAQQTLRALQQVADKYYEVAAALNEADAQSILMVSNSIEDFNRLADAAVAARAKQESMEDVAFQVGDMSLDDYLAALRMRLAATEKYSEDYGRIWSQINAITEQKAAEQAALLEEHNRKIQELTSELEGVYLDAHRKYVDQQEAYADSVKQVQKRIADETKSFRDGIVESYRDLSDPVKLFGGAKNVTAGGIERALKHRIDAAAKFADTYKQLVARGLDKQVLTDLAKGGPENLGVAQALLKVDPALVNDALKSTSSIGGQVADVALQWESSRISTEAYADATFPVMKTMAQLLQEEIALWKEKNALQDEAARWAGRMAKNEDIQRSSEGGRRGRPEQTADEFRRMMGFPDVVPGQPYLPGKKILPDGSILYPPTAPLGSYQPGDVWDEMLQQWRVQSFDSGGWLQPGMTMAYNGTGAPERVGGPLVTVAPGAVTITAGSGVGEAEMKRMVDDGFQQLARHIERGVRR